MLAVSKFWFMAVVVLSALLITSGCDDEQNSRPSSTAAVDSLRPDQITSDAHIYLYSAGHKTSDIRADKIIQFTQLDSMIAFNLDTDFFDSTGTLVSTLTAQSGYIRENDNFLSVTGRVVVVGEDSVKLLTEYLEWDAAHERVATDSFVTVIDHGDTLRSYGLVTDPRLRDIIFKRQVSGRKALTEETEEQDNDR